MGAVQGNRETVNETPSGGIHIDPSEMIDELLNRNAQLTMELAAKDILIRKLQEMKVVDEDG